MLAKYQLGQTPSGLRPISVQSQSRLRRDARPLIRPSSRASVTTPSSYAMAVRMLRCGSASGGSKSERCDEDWKGGWLLLGTSDGSKGD